MAQLYRTAAHVAALTKRFNSLNVRSDQVEDVYDIIADELQLDNLQQDLFRAEVDFLQIFSNYRITTPESAKQALDDLNERLRAIKSSPLGQLYNNANNIAREAGGKEILVIEDGDVVDALNHMIQTQGIKFDNDISFQETMISTLSKGFDSVQINGTTVTRKAYFSGKTKENLRFVVDHSDPENPRITDVYMNDIEYSPLTEGMLRRIYNLAKGIKVRPRRRKRKDGEYNYSIDITQLQRNLDAVLEKYLGNTVINGIDVLASMKRELWQGIANHEYDMNISTSSIIGFLGEAAFKTTMRILFQNQNPPVQMMGTVRALSQGGEIGMDALVAGAGFQIKNYTLDEYGNVTFSSSMGAGNFIQNRMHATGTVGDILLELFSAYHFNQPFRGAAEAKYNAHPTNGLTVADYRAYIYSNLDATIQKTNKLFQYYIGNIIEVLGHSNFILPGSHQLIQGYQNAFFVVNGELYPGSLIIQNIKEQLLEQIGNTMGDHYDEMVHGTFEITNGRSEHNTLSSYVNQELANSDAIGTRTKRHASYSADAYGMANFIKIHYEITLDLNKILGMNTL